MTKNKQLTLEAFRRNYTDRKTKLEAASEAMSTGTGPAKAVAEAREQLDAVCTAIAETLFD